MFDISSLRMPQSPGCYLFKSSGGTIIYIGKAKNLKNRVRSYFDSPHEGKTSKLVSEIESVEFVLTDNEAEALLLENNLIRTHYPKYNIDLKDSDRFTYIQITNEPFPRMLLVRKNRAGKIKTKGKLYGPFTGGSAYLLVASTLRKIFKVRICKRLPKRVCLQYFLGNCDAPCEGKTTREEYMKNIAALESVLSGKEGLEETISSLRATMRLASTSLDFEKAKQIRDSIRVLEGITQRQKVEQLGSGNEDFISFHADGGKCSVQMFRVVGGVIRERKKFNFDARAEDDAIGAFLSGFYSANPIPPHIYVDAQPDSQGALEEFLSVLRNGPVRITLPEKGDKKKLLELLRKNIYSEMSGNADPSLVEIKAALGLPSIPYTIECFDISNLFGTNVVASMVQFVNARPSKQNYRRFKMRSVEGQDDFASMREVVYRRYKRLRDEGAKMPDLIVIDGGPGQLSAALSSLRELGLQIPCVSLAKKRRGNLPSGAARAD